ncbi:hypothetical protein IRJ41_001439, partial [Triplophysa rosa]
RCPRQCKDEHQVGWSCAIRIKRCMTVNFRLNEHLPFCQRVRLLLAAFLFP